MKGLPQLIDLKKKVHEIILEENTFFVDSNKSR